MHEVGVSAKPLPLTRQTVGQERAKNVESNNTAEAMFPVRFRKRKQDA